MLPTLDAYPLTSSVTDGLAQRHDVCVTGAAVGHQEAKSRFGSFLDTPIWQGPVALLTCAVLTSAAWLVGVLLPYYVNDLDSLPMSEVTSGAHDPKDMWPVTAGPVGGLMHLAGVLAGMGGVFILGAIAVWTLWSLAGRWSVTTAPLRVVYVAALSVSLIMIPVIVSPFASDLLVWSQD
jgi:hypothetical protein